MQNWNILIENISGSLIQCEIQIKKVRKKVKIGAVKTNKNIFWGIKFFHMILFSVWIFRWKKNIYTSTYVSLPKFRLSHYLSKVNFPRLFYSNRRPIFKRFCVFFGWLGHLFVVKIWNLKLLEEGGY